LSAPVGCTFGFERVASRPERPYGVGLGSSYQHQTLTLSKQFRQA